MCENAHELLKLVPRLGAAVTHQDELMQMALESVAEVVCAVRNAARRKEDLFRSLEDIDNKFATQRDHVQKLNAQGSKVTLQERLKNSSDLVKLATRKLEMLVGASSALGMTGNSNLGKNADVARKFMVRFYRNTTATATFFSSLSVFCRTK